MSETEKRILDTFKKVIPELSEIEREKLLSFGEGMAFMKQRSEDGAGQRNEIPVA